MLVKRLSQEQLIYELKIRSGTTPKTVDSMRKIFSYLCKVGKSESFAWPEYPYKFKEDVKARTDSVQELKDMCKDFSGDVKSSEYRKISSCFGSTHLPTSDDEHKTRSGLLVSLATLAASLKSKAKALPRSSTMDRSVIDLSQAAVSQSSPVPSSDDDSDVESSPRAGVSSMPSTSSRKSIPVMNGLKYSGDNKEVSLNAFLERV
ncbi:hypothetical protein QE152_g27235 [Popillia japonica]|uniref:Uncharacterized protein n=1 Tax=Popillia japonica TaxID=7064 RepID=A0AAW1JTW1_POPJA